MSRPHETQPSPRFQSGPRALVGSLLTGLILFGAIGCGGTPKAKPEKPPGLVALPPLPPKAQTFDYTQRPLNQMTEDERAAYIEEHYAAKLDPRVNTRPPTDVFGDEYEHRLRAVPGMRSHVIIERRLLPDDRTWTVIGPGYSPYRELPPQYHRSYHTYRHRNPRYDFPANTILYGALGGVIGHQSDHRDEGIIIGGTYGLLLDLMRW